MKYIKKYKLFEASSDYYKREQDIIVDGIINDIKKIFKKLHLDYITFPNDDPNIPSIMRNTEKYEAEFNNYKLIGVEMKKCYLYNLYVYKNSVHCEYFGGDAEIDEDIRKMPFHEVVDIYKYLENIDLVDVINAFIDNDNHYQLADLIEANIKTINFDSIGRKDIFELVDDEYESYEKIIESEEFQKWLCEEKTDKIKWLLETECDIHDNIKKEYSHLFDSEELGLL